MFRCLTSQIGGVVLRNRGMAKMVRVVRTMRAAVVLLAATVISIGSARAQFFDPQQAQAQCELSAIGSTRSDLALSWIRTACNRLAVDTGPLHESNRRFHECLVRNLSGVQRDSAASQIINACRISFPP
jgi:hypothetical protein